MTSQDKLIADLEKHLVANPNANVIARRLVDTLETHVPNLPGFGRYSDCQRKFVKQYGDPEFVTDMLKSGNYPAEYKHWKSLMHASGLNPQFWIHQLYVGNFHVINGTKTRCGERLELFDQKGVISKLCYDCHKVQIIPADLIGLVKTYFILRALKLPRDNARKCMVEVREKVSFPYKAYIYCESEEEALYCRGLFQDLMKEYQIQGLRCEISHGCSEHGLKHPDFKYSEDGSYKDFPRPPEWDDIEALFFATKRKGIPFRKDYNKPGISLRDVIGFDSWIDYAEMIGDNTWKFFRDKPKAKNNIPGFERIQKQTAIRSEQLRKLSESMTVEG